MASATLCDGCLTMRDIVYTEEGTDRQFCQECALALPPTSEELALLFLSLSIPFKVGDRVEARTAGEVYDGIGTVTRISTQLQHGGTPVYPSFYVDLETREHDRAPEDGAWYTEVCLRKIGVAA